ncbi:MAG TPA: YfhO family protein [Pyrinomonadaceae bacterium]|jgi:hypothetical protein
MSRPSNPRPPRPTPRPRVALGRDRVAALAVSLAPVLYFLPAIAAGSVLCPDDGTIFNTPLRVAAAGVTLGGSLPLWNPYIFSGMPLLATAQGGLLFPLNWFYLAFSPQAATNLMVVGSYVVAAAGAYLYARRAGASVAGAVVTSLAWQWGGFLVGQIGHINVVQTGAVLPWVLWAVDGYGATGGRGRGAALAALVALQTFAGHQQTLAYSLLLVAAYAAASARAASGESRALYLRSLAFVVTGVLLAAVQILPTFELLRNSLRADSSYDFFTSFSLPPWMLGTFLAPYFAGGGDGALYRAPYVGPPYYGEMAGYVGALGLMLAACAVLFRRDARTKFWAAAALVCLLLALGRYAPLGFYKLVYHVPVLNLFRVPARHLLEAEFALAVLAGRGLTALAAARAGGGGGALRRAAVVGGVAVLLTLLLVTWGRPDEFRLARQAPVSLMRAPELFVPVLVACLSAWALWAFARGRRGATVLLVGLLALDLALWGQFTGWRRSSPTLDGDLWREPEPLALIRRHAAPADASDYRILTAPHAFDPAVAPVPPSVSHSTEWTLWTQPDVYMMHGAQNAAGYDGFGLARYSRLAGEMKVWGELTDPERTLRGEGRELDLLGVRYLVSMRAKGAGAKPAAGGAQGAGGAADASAREVAPASAPVPAQEFPAAAERFGDASFAAGDLGLPNLGAGRSLRFQIAPTEVDRVSLVTNLSWSENVPDGATVGRVRLRAQDGRVFDFALRAGADTAEWAHDRADIRARVRHKRANVATSYAVTDAGGGYEGHTYVATFTLPARAAITAGEISAVPSPQWPDLLLGVYRVSLADAADGRAYPLRREWLSVEQAAAAGAGRAQAGGDGTLTFTGEKRRRAKDGAGGEAGGAGRTGGAVKQTGGEVEAAGGEVKQAGGDAGGARWRLLGQTAREEVYENARALPRAWLAPEALSLEAEATLGVIRAGRLPDGSRWEPLRTALVETGEESSSAPPSAAPPGAGAEVTRYEPNRVDVKTKSGAPSVLVLAENYYPGWRAYLDGERVGMLRVNYGLRGVRVPAGEHEVRFLYRPASALAGLVVSLLAAAALLLWWRRWLPEARLRAALQRLRAAGARRGGAPPPPFKGVPQ